MLLLVRLVAQSVVSATDTLGHWDILYSVHGLSAIDPCSRQWNSIYSLHYAQGYWHAVTAGVDNRPLMSVYGTVG